MVAGWSIVAGIGVVIGAVVVWRRRRTELI